MFQLKSLYSQHVQIRTSVLFKHLFLKTTLSYMFQLKSLYSQHVQQTNLCSLINWFRKTILFYTFNQKIFPFFMFNHNIYSPHINWSQKTILRISILPHMRLINYEQCSLLLSFSFQTIHHFLSCINLIIFDSGNFFLFLHVHHLYISSLLSSY